MSSVTPTMTMQMHALPDASAIQDSRNLMQAFEKALQKNPAADLLALVPDSYH